MTKMMHDFPDIETAARLFSGDDPIACRDHVRQKLGLPAFKGNGSKERFTEADIERAVFMAAASRAPKPIAIYDYTDADGTLLYQVCRYEPKRFGHRQPDGNGGWIYKGADRRVVYRWPEIIKYPDATIFVTEGERDADNVAALDLCATTVASGDWTDDCAHAFTNRNVIILQDNDEAGHKKAREAAALLHGVANTLRVVLLPGLPDRGDVSDWLDAGHTKDQLIEACFDIPLWEREALNSQCLRSTRSCRSTPTLSISSTICSRALGWR
jgi:hypothetical protein